jgi:excisionase family DNA binding protein
LLLDVKQVAAMLNCSERHVYRMSDSGAMPRLLHLGASVRWNRAEIEQWIADGCKPVRAAGKGVRA